MHHSLSVAAGGAAIAALLVFLLHNAAAWSCPYVAAACFDQPIEQASEYAQDDSPTLLADLRPPSTPGIVYLTFDDGPNPDFTPQILDILRRYQARATFFVTGSSASTYPELIARIVAEGHSVANHSWGHEKLTQLSAAEITDNLQRTQWALAPHATSCFRPPYFAFNDDVQAAAGSLGLSMVLGSLAAEDWNRPGADVIAERIVAMVYEGSIVVLHDGGGERSQTVTGLATAMEHLAEQGYRFASIC